MHFVRYAAMFCISALASSQISAQVLTRPNAGFNTAEAIQVFSTDTTQNPPYFLLSSLSAQDVDGDGKTDLLVTGQNSVSNPLPLVTTLLRNTGNKNFQLVKGSNSSYCLPHYILPPSGSSAPPFCTLADLNHDGMQDKIFAGEYVNASNPSEVDYPYINVEYATGAGTYSSPVKYVLGGKGFYITSIATGDFNGDGQTDIAVLRIPQNPSPGSSLLIADVVLLLSDAQGGFTISATYNTGVFRNGSSLFPQLVSLDLNSDNKADVIVYDGTGDSNVGVLFGSTNGLTRQPDIPVQNTNFDIQAAGDFNHDGYGDILVNEADGAHVLCGGPGGAIYGYFSRDQLLAVSERSALFAESVGVADDFNHDGLVDVAISNGTDITVFLQQSNGSFSLLRQYAAGGLSLIAADFDGDGNLDLASGGNPVNILYGSANGSFNAPPVSSNFGTAGPVVSADFNRDGIPDIASAWAGKCTPTGCSNFVSIFAGSGQGWFLPPQSYSVQIAVSGIAAGDLNGDGITDLVIIGRNPPLSDTRDTAVLLGNADGTFSPAKAYTLGIGGDGSVILRDMNNDGKLDLIVGGGIAFGNGNGTFASVTAQGTGQIADLNHDGNLDMLAVAGSGVTEHLGDGHGNFYVNSDCCSSMQHVLPGIFSCNRRSQRRWHP